jgi:hypothetical protein
VETADRPCQPDATHKKNLADEVFRNLFIPHEPEPERAFRTALSLGWSGWSGPRFDGKGKKFFKLSQ